MGLLSYRVVFVIQKLAGLRGGAERVLVELARTLARRGGMDVRILSCEANPAPPAYELGGITHDNLFPLSGRRIARPAPARDGYRRTRRLELLVRRVPDSAGLQHLKWALTHGMFAGRLRPDLLAARPDAVIAFLPPAIAATGWALRGMAPAEQPAFIASTHNMPEADFADGSQRWDQNPLYRRRAREALGRAQVITTPSPAFTDTFPATLGGRLEVIPNPVRRLAPRPEIPAPREPLILGVGRLAPVKRFDLLVNAFAKIAPAFPEWRVIIHGEGAERAALEARVEKLGLADRVHLPGTTERIAEAYDRAALLCHPAEFEGFGLAVAEAMAHGLPPVAFADCPGVNGLIRDGETGLLVQGGPTEPVDALAAALDRLVRDSALRDRLGAAAHGITARFDADEIARRWEAAIETAVTARRADGVET